MPQYRGRATDIETYFLSAVQILDSAVRLAVPLLLASFGGLYAERSGIIDIGLEGKMLVGAFAAAAAAFATGSAWMGLGAGILASIVLALVHGFASITQKGNQIVSGVAINFFAIGITVQFGQTWFAQGGRTPQLAMSERFAEISLPFAEAAEPLPFLGPLYANLVSGQNVLVYVAFALVPVTYYVLGTTRFGLRLRAVGDNPGAVDSAGISVAWVRYRALIICGVLCGMAGAYLSIAQSAGFIREMSAGKGFIALAALIFANWRPVRLLFACLIFGFLDAAAIRMQGTSLFGLGQVPVQFMQALPFVLTIVLLAGFIGRPTPPKAGGIPYRKER